MEQLQELNAELPEIKIWNNQRVVTFKDIDEVHHRKTGTARKRFNDNKKHFILGTDYFVRNSDEAKQEYNITAPNGLVLLTESGYLMIVKSFKDDLAWEVQRKLVNGYFKIRQESQLATVGIPEETLLQICGFIRQQSELNQRMMDRFEMVESRNENNIYEGFYLNCIGEKSQIEERKEYLYRQVAEASELYGQSQTTILHNLYCALEKLLGIDLDSYKSVYRSETGNKKAGMVEVIAANDRLYENAVHMNQYAIDKY